MSKKKTKKSQMEADIEIYQNDRTKPLPKEAYEQEDQELRYENPEPSIKQFSCGGMGKAYKGGKFIGCK
jgi:protein associated with RNAse G/E